VAPVSVRWENRPQKARGLGEVAKVKHDGSRINSRARRMAQPSDWKRSVLAPHVGGRIPRPC
jgi:hypothetical protein